ncbi:hypothetical protein ATANTOWER_004607 [Ataeniobius toweri]|uniref:Uncharacterized protein n=1 Tax=Ataeniobius toweri TaxID=208326 RepID=A0ABU7BWQ4_9TELE|nr:hypothetical protein [Ataeniobius toweri]
MNVPLPLTLSSLADVSALFLESSSGYSGTEAHPSAACATETHSDFRLNGFFAVLSAGVISTPVPQSSCSQTPAVCLQKRMDLLPDLWRQEYWLPPGVTWKDLEQLPDSERPHPKDLLIALPLALAFVVVRCVFERYSTSELTVQERCGV